MASAHRIEVQYKQDPRVKSRTDRLRSLGFSSAEEVLLVDVYTISTESRDFNAGELGKIAAQLINPVVQDFKIDAATRGDFDFAIEVGFLPGVTDNAGNTAKQTIEDFFKVRFRQDEAVHTSQLFLVKGKLSAASVKKLATTLANPLVNRVHVKTRQEYGEKGMGVVVPRVQLNDMPVAEPVDLDIGDAELAKLGKEGIVDAKTGARRGPLALDLGQLKAIRTHFGKKGRKPTDVELESLAQTWSEHCKHTIFASAMDDDVPQGLYKTYIQGATNRIRKERGKDDICVSVFTDNSGAIKFDDSNLVTHKVETHNSPSALDPFGGALTGIVGVNRDTIGFGLGAKPCINYYGYCVADPETSPELYRGKGKSNPILPPRQILDGVVRGVAVGGNCSGIPTPQGWCYFDARYAGKPLIFVGTVGVMPREENGPLSAGSGKGPLPLSPTGERGAILQQQNVRSVKRKVGRKLYEKKAQPGDLIVMAGGRVGKDGIHGATFSSEALDSGSPMTAVQIGDPITQKKLSDAIVKEARGLELYTSITDNGAGGISCSVAEMAKESGGCHVQLEKVPLKYPGMAPWEIWVSESQERMTLAVPPAKLAALLELLQRRDVEATVIGKFTDSGKCVVEWNGETVMDVELEFLHNGLPKKHLKTAYSQKNYPEPRQACPSDLGPTLLDMMRRKNLCSKEYISTQYDYVVQGGHVLGPLQGKGEVQAMASLTKVVPDSKKGVGLSQGLYPLYSEIDPYGMAAAAIDTAIRGLIAIGVPLDRLALLDNFCWCSSNEPERLGQLKRAAKACYDYATAFGTPFISGKDSMFNDFSGFDADNRPVKMSVPPTLLISSIGIHADVTKAVSMDAKCAGDLVYVVGETLEELGGSEYFAYLGSPGNNVPKLDANAAKARYEKLSSAIEQELVASAFPVSHGGLGIALAKVSIAGRLGMKLAIPQVMRPDFYLFSESQGRFVVTVCPENRQKLEKILGEAAHLLGTVGGSNFTITAAKKIVDLPMAQLEEAYKSTFKGY
ncbi:Phosphoribosylformylglycinamidine synthase subunit PurL [Candidatus Burarchaeum australiense]|nr:Phosphoribosylformylglycinamidine synthase subunit PurL [Candidatus Burarchaeum australiense]